jgi:glycosyltransferase involved in cell wall biosynthesis
VKGKPELSIVVITRDEAARMPAFFKALERLELRSEVIVLDSRSKDATLAIAKAKGAKVFQVRWKGFAATKNAGFAKAKADWILSLDADENPDKELLRSLAETVRKNRKDRDVYSVNRLNYFLGRPVWRGGWHPDRQLRLFRKGTARFDERLVHEGLEPLTGAVTGRLDGLLHHHSYPDLGGYLSRLNRYTSLQAREIFNKRGARPAWAALRMLADPPLTFFKMYVLKLGVLEGRRGLALAQLSASSTFWKYAKYWHLSWKAKGGSAGDPWVLG